ncbi:uncharacterized protein TNCT_126171 [Trichonephila clavata]|uniref:Gustatory receptor n=1 Tax=Trichonephila clavata TaxID=2740835 RepID=A0A8X6HUL5_TRICU|nr:uncharacterized protein TNCT_126171 [Trichonephila clavata]
MHFKSITTVKQIHKKDLRNSIPEFILKFFRWVGFVQVSDQPSVVAYVLDFVVFFTSLDTIVNVILLYDPSSSKIDKIFISSFLLTMIVWCSMRYKRKRITEFFQKLETIGSIFQAKKFNILMFLNGCVPVIYSACLTSGMTQSEAAKYFFYDYQIKNTSIQTVITAIKCFLGYMVYPTAINSIAIFYIFLCFCSSDHLSNLTRIIETSPLEDFTPSKQIDILKRRTKVYDVLLNVEKIFSFPIFLIIIANVLMLSCVSGWFIIDDWNKTNFSWKIECILYGTNAGLCVASILWAAGAVSIEMKNFKEVFHYKIQLKLLRKHSEEQLHLKMYLMDEPDVVLTGWNVLYLGRGTILGLIGTLFTYTVLVMHTDI